MMGVWGLQVTNYGEVRYKTGGGGGAMKCYPYEKGGGSGKSFSHAKGGHKKFWGSFFTLYLEVLAILKGGRKMFLIF